jgi:hypothetical protein
MSGGCYRCIAVISLPLEVGRKLRAKTQPEQCHGGHRTEADGWGIKKAPGFPKPGALIPTSFINPT